MPIPVATPAAAPAAPSAAPVKPSAAPVKTNPVGSSPVPSNGSSPAPGSSPPKPEGTAPPSRFTRKERIDGKEVELSATEEELWAAHRKASTLDRRFEENAQHRKEIAAERARNEQMFARLRNPKELLKVFMEANPEADPIEVMSTILQERLTEEEQLQDPNIRERRRLERENEQYKSKEQQQLEQQELAAQEEATQNALNEISSTFMEALSQTKLPHSDITLELMAKVESTNRKQGWKLSPVQLARATEKAVNSMIENIVNNPDSSDDQVLDAFPALTKRIHKAIVGRYNARKGAQQQQRAADVTPRERRPSSEEQPKQRMVNSVEEHKAFGGKGLRTL